MKTKKKKNELKKQNSIKQYFNSNSTSALKSKSKLTQPSTNSSSPLSLLSELTETNNSPSSQIKKLKTKTTTTTTTTTKELEKENYTQHPRNLETTNHKTVNLPQQPLVHSTSSDSTVLGLNSSSSESQEEMVILSSLIPNSPNQSIIDSNQKIKKSQQKINTTPPSQITPSPPSQSNIHLDPLPLPISPITKKKFNSDDLDELDREDEWLTRALDSNFNKKTQQSPHLLTPKITTKATPFLSTQPTRRSERNKVKPRQSLDSTASAPLKPSTIMKLHPAQSSASRIPDKFSFNSILKDRQLRQERQANLVKRKREEFDHFDSNQLPDELHPDSIRISPNKKINSNNTLQHQSDDPKKNKNDKSTNVNSLNLMCQDEDEERDHQNQNHNNNNNHLEYTSDLFTSPSKLEILRENIESLQQPDHSEKNGSKKKARTGAVHKLIEQDIETGQLAGLNRGLGFRQVFKKTVFESVNPHSEILHPTLISFEENYINQIGVSLDQDTVDFVHEIIDNLNHSIKYPDFLSIDLVNFIPIELSGENQTSSEEGGSGSSAKSQEENMNITHQTILKILFQPIIDPQFSLEVVQKSVFLIDSYIKSLNFSPPTNDCNSKDESFAEFWLSTFQNALVKLGVLDRLVYFGEFILNNEDEKGNTHDNDTVIELDFESRIERIRSILNLFSLLSTSDQLNERGRRWALTISMRLGVEPSSFKLRAEIVTYISNVLNRISNSSLLTKSINTNEKDSGMMKKEETIKLVTEILKIGLDLKTWTNILELLRLISNRFQFRKFLAIGFLDLAGFHPKFYTNTNRDDDLRQSQNLERVIPKMARWLTHISNKFMNPPPAREIYNSIRQVSKRPYEELDLVENESEGQKEKNQIREETRVNINKQKKEIQGDGEGIDEEKKKKKLRTKTNKKQKEKFRFSFEWYLGESEDEKGRKTARMNEIQFKDLIEIFQIILIGVWDYLIDYENRDQVKTSGYNHHHNNLSDFGCLPPSFSTSGNVWIKLIQQSLDSLDSKITSNASPQFKADRIKLKNSIYRLSSSLDFLNQESFLIIKGIDSKGQFKLDKFFSKG